VPALNEMNRTDALLELPCARGAGVVHALFSSSAEPTIYPASAASVAGTPCRCDG
jgi:hypothetical protein